MLFDRHPFISVYSACSVVQISLKPKENRRADFNVCIFSSLSVAINPADFFFGQGLNMVQIDGTIPEKAVFFSKENLRTSDSLAKGMGRAFLFSGCTIKGGELRALFFFSLPLREGLREGVPVNPGWGKLNRPRRSAVVCGK